MAHLSNSQRRYVTERINEWIKGLLAVPLSVSVLTFTPTEILHRRKKQLWFWRERDFYIGWNASVRSHWTWEVYYRAQAHRLPVLQLLPKAELETNREWLEGTVTNWGRRCTGARKPRWISYYHEKWDRACKELALFCQVWNLPEPVLDEDLTGRIAAKYVTQQLKGV